MKSRYLSLLLIVLIGFLSGAAHAAEEQDIFPDQEVFKQIIQDGLSARHEEALKLATVYTEKHQNHPCGYFVQGLVHEWIIEPMSPEPYLGPAIEGFEEAGKRKAYTEAERKDAAAGICRGAALIRLSRIYYKYGQYLTATHRAIAGGKELERVSAMAPEAYDLYTFLGPYHYFTDRAPKPVQMLFRLFGLKGNKEKGLNELQLAREKAPLFRDEAGHVLYVIQTKFEHNYDKQYDEILSDLMERYPQNLVFRRLRVAARQQLASSRLDTRHEAKPLSSP